MEYENMIFLLHDRKPTEDENLTLDFRLWQCLDRKEKSSVTILLGRMLSPPLVHGMFF